jgi:hypothetical protein
LPLQRHPDRKTRTAQLAVRLGYVTLRRPQRADTEVESLTLTVVDVQEIDPPEGETAVHWLLLTALPVRNTDEACQITT